MMTEHGSKHRPIPELAPPGGGEWPGQDGRDDHGHGPLRAALDEAVAVQADAEDEVDAVPGHDDGEETEDRGEDQREGVEPAGEAAVQWDQVDQQGDEGPDLLGI